MKLKLIAAAALLAATGAANAAIDTGNTGNGDLFLSIWDSASSYTADLNITIDAFQAAIAAPGDFSSVFNLTTDSKFTSFLSGVNLAELTWNIVATDAIGARRVINTFSTIGAQRIVSGDARTMSGTAIPTFLTAVNNGIALQGGDSAVFAANTPGYANNTANGSIQFGNSNGGFAGLGFSNTGTAANNSYADGLNLLRIDAGASGSANSVYTSYADGGTALRAYLTSSGLTIAAVTAVPEPETYAMLLAGLGLMGAIARRRRNQA